MILSPRSRRVLIIFSTSTCLLYTSIPWEDTIVFGDSNNDLAMFEYAAVKVAMGNGSEKIKALADHITQDMLSLIHI